MIIKRSITLNGHQTSYSLEAEFQHELEALAKTDNISLSQLVTRIDATREPDTNLSSALRLYVLAALKEQVG